MERVHRLRRPLRSRRLTASPFLISPATVSAFSLAPNSSDLSSKSISLNEETASPRGGSLWDNVLSRRAKETREKAKEREQAAHLHRGVSEYRAARLGLYQRAFGRSLRAFLHGAVAVRRSAARGRRGRGHHSFHRISAHGGCRGAPGNFHRREARSPESAAAGEQTH